MRRPERGDFLFGLAATDKIAPNGLKLQRGFWYHLCSFGVIGMLSMKDIAVLVRNARKEQKATQVELAQFANVGTRFVRDVEDGKESVQFDKLMRVLSTLGLKVEIAR